MQTPQRNYHAKDVDFIIAADTIINSAIANQAFLKSKRSTWTAEYFQSIKDQIDQATQTHLGIDNAKELRMATQLVYNIAADALNTLSEVKVQIEEDFKNTPAERTEILNALGFTSYFADARNDDQEALINLLFQFKANLTQQLSNLMVFKGMAQVTLDLITNQADALKEADVFQEGQKGARKEITAAAINEFNDIYDKIISIARIASKFYKGDKAKCDQFSFTKVARTINRVKLPKKNAE
jgi:hypothetical protein